MKNINLTEQNISFKTALGVSLAFHSVFISFFILKWVFFPFEPIEYQSAIRVDLVALPDKIEDKTAVEEAAAPQTKPSEPEKQSPPDKKSEPPQPPVQPEVAIKPTPKNAEPDAINLKKSKSKQQEALERIKKMEAIERIKESLKSEKTETKSSNTNNDAQPTKSTFKGNVLSAGTELTGLNQLQHDAYVGQIDRHVKKHWALPEWMMNKNYKAQVLFKIDNDGNILSAQLIKSSGNPSYDELTLEAVNKASPYPKPPEKFRDIVSIKGILLGFPE